MLSTVSLIYEPVYNFFMHNAQMLKNARDLTLKLHKVLIDHENGEMVDGPISPSRLLTMLLKTELSWLRRFSTPTDIVNAAQRDGWKTPSRPI